MSAPMPPQASQWWKADGYRQNNSVFFTLGKDTTLGSLIHDSTKQRYLTFEYINHSILRMMLRPVGQPRQISASRQRVGLPLLIK